MDTVLLGLTYLRPGQFPATRDVLLAVAPGEGQMLLDPEMPPALGTVQAGRLVIASENFPRFAPLTLTIAGADLRFRVRSGRLLSFAMRHQGEDCLRLACPSLYRAAYRHTLTWRPENQLTIRRFNSLDGDRETHLSVTVLKGSIAVGEPGFEKDAGGLVRWGSLDVRRAAGGQLQLQFHGARMEWAVVGGTVVGLRLYDSLGPVAQFHLQNHSRAGVTASLSILDTLP